MILNGRPSDWSGANGSESIRRDPPRSEDVIPSDKADSLSWSVSEQKEIDRQLRRAWESTLAELPNRPADTGGPSVYSGRILPEDMSRLQKFGIPYVFGNPAGLYMAHPKWPKQPSDELDDRTLYYCSQDIDRHLKSWEQAVLEEGIRLHQDEKRCRTLPPPAPRPMASAAGVGAVQQDHYLLGTGAASASPRDCRDSTPRGSDLIPRDSRQLMQIFPQYQYSGVRRCLTARNADRAVLIELGRFLAEIPTPLTLT